MYIRPQRAPWGPLDSGLIGSGIQDPDPDPGHFCLFFLKGHLVLQLDFDPGFALTGLLLYPGFALPGFCPTRVLLYPGFALPGFCSTLVLLYPGFALPVICSTRVLLYLGFALPRF